MFVEELAFCNTTSIIFIIYSSRKKVKIKTENTRVCLKCTCLHHTTINCLFCPCYISCFLSFLLLLIKLLTFYGYNNWICQLQLQPIFNLSVSSSTWASPPWPNAATSTIAATTPAATRSTTVMRSSRTVWKPSAGMFKGLWDWPRVSKVRSGATVTCHSDTTLVFVNIVLSFKHLSLCCSCSVCQNNFKWLQNWATFIQVVSLLKGTCSLVLCIWSLAPPEQPHTISLSEGFGDVCLLPHRLPILFFIRWKMLCFLYFTLSFPSATTPASQWFAIDFFFFFSTHVQQIRVTLDLSYSLAVTTVADIFETSLQLLWVLVLF